VVERDSVVTGGTRHLLQEGASLVALKKGKEGPPATGPEADAVRLRGLITSANDLVDRLTSPEYDVKASAQAATDIEAQAASSSELANHITNVTGNVRSGLDAADKCAEMLRELT